MKKIFTVSLVLLSAALFAQEQRVPAPGSSEYDQLKKEGKLENVNAASRTADAMIMPVIQNGVIMHPPITQSSGCQCMMPLDSTFSVVPMNIGSPPDYRNDDGSSSLISIPFNFCFYGQSYNGIYINNNGNISFGSAYSTFSASGFPSSSFSMVAPFWADVDTRGAASGLVYYKVTPTAVIVKWEGVGYYSMHTDKFNTFQLIITDGTDPLVPGGNNVSFCYGNMDWTTGDASSGSGGFGGVPSTVGANEGNGVDYIQFGRFDSPGQNYSGPFPAGPPYEGVDWLDNKSFVFSTCNSNNIAPIPSGISSCDTIKICGFNDTLVINSFFMSPEVGQNTSVTITAPGVTGFSVISNTSGNTAYSSAQLIGMPSNLGYNTIIFSATDNGSPAQTTTVNVVVLVDTSGNSFNPVITGASPICSGNQVTLDAGTGYDSYTWSNGYSSQTITVNQPGNYWVTVSQNSCVKTTSVNISQLPSPTPVITGQSLICAAGTTTLSTSQPYVTYQWSPAGNGSSITVGPGTYTVTVTDSTTCPGTATFTVNGYTPVISVTGQTTICTNATTTLTASPGFDSYTWSSGDTTQAASVGAGTYNVTGIDSNGCTAAASYTVTATGPTVTITGAQPFCPGDSIQLSAVSATAVSYLWNTGQTSSTASSGGGTVAVTVTDALGCTSADTVVVNPEPVPDASFTISPPGTANVNTAVLFDDGSTVASGNIITWTWYFSDHDTSYVQNPSHIFTQPGVYTVTLVVQTQSGCRDTVTLEYTVVGEVIPPNVFTPNGDGKNETFEFKYLEFYSNSTLQVFNRWGNKVFESGNYSNDWNAKDVSDGAYYYILTVPALEKTFRGFVEIIR